MKAWKLGFGLIAIISLAMVFIGDGVMVKSLNAALFVVSIVVIFVVARRERAGKDSS